MRLAFWRTEKPVARPVLQPGADSPYVPRLGVWMEPAPPEQRDWFICHQCGEPHAHYRVYRVKETGYAVCEGCGAKLVARLRREREG